MQSTVPHRHLWSPDNLSSDDVQALLQTTAMLKHASQQGHHRGPLRGRYLALLCSPHTDAATVFQRAVVDLGGTPVLLNADEWRRRASDRLPGEARMLGQLYDAIDCCDLPPAIVEVIETNSGVPVFNGLSKADHPLSLIGDILTMREAVRKPLNLCRVAVRAEDSSSADSPALAIARLAGMHVLARNAPTASGAAETAVGLADADFVLDPAAPPSACRLTMAHATSTDQAHVNGQLQANRQYALEAAIFCGLQ